MLNRRLIVLFILFTCGFLILGFRLARLQFVDADELRERMRAATHHHDPIETARGSILDRNGVVLAQDIVCDDLAIDYRAMNLDDRWLRNKALPRIRDEKFDSRLARANRLDEVKRQIAAQIDAIPDAISRVCGIPKEDVLGRFQNIRERIQLLHEDLWSRHYNRDDPATEESDEADNTADAAFKASDLKEERLAHTIVHNIPNAIANYFRQHADEFPGLIVRDNANARYYPNADVGCQVIGTLNSINPDSKRYQSNKFLLPNLLADDHPGNLGGYLPGDDAGESGAEAAYETQLHGTRGVRLTEIGVAGNTTSEKRVDPIPGKNVRLTLDVALQRDLQNALKNPARHLRFSDQDHQEHNVALVILSLDGQVVTMISWPTYDPNTIDTNRVALNSDQVRRPLANRALEAYQPGSTVKPLLASGALFDGTITAQTAVTCNGYLFPDHPNQFRCAIYAESHGTQVHGRLELADAIAQSCNIYFYSLGRALGIEKIHNWFDAYGLGRDTGFPLYEANGQIPKLGGERDPQTDRVDALQLGIGQGPVTATPLQMANAYATLLRGGVNIAPRLNLDDPIHSEQRFQLSPAIVNTLRDGLTRVVTRGTAKDMFGGFQLPIGGKTGTADTSRPAFDENGQPAYDTTRPLLNHDGTPRLDRNGKPLFARVSQTGTDAWFVAYAPADQPKFVVAAVMEFGGFGGKAAAPMVKEALLQLEKHNYLPPMDVQSAAQ